MTNFLRTLNKNETAKVFLSLLLTITLLLLSFGAKGLCSDEILVFLDILIVLISYGWGARMINKHIEFDVREIPMGALLYVVLAVLYILFYSMIYSVFDLASPSTNMTLRNLDTTDALYFSAATFTTLGFGDFLPNSHTGKLAVITQSILGTVHTVFFVLIFLRNGQPTATTH